MNKIDINDCMVIDGVLYQIVDNEYTGVVTE